MKSEITLIQLHSNISNFIENQGSQKKAAEILGISPQYLNDIIMGRRPISDRVARKFGYAGIIQFGRIQKNVT